MCKKKNKVAANELGEILSTQTEHGKFQDKYYTTLILEGKKVRFEIDSGAAVTIVSKAFARLLCPDLRIEKSSLQLITFCKTTIPVVGFVKVQVHYGDTIKALNMYVTNTDREPLMGREWIRQLKVQLSDTLDTLNADTSKEVEKMLHEYRQGLDSNSSKIKKIQARLTFKDNTRPVFLKARKVPFTLIPLVKKEIERLENAGILEKINTSAWAIPIVPMLKKDGTVRLCGDFSVTLNKYLLVDEHIANPR